MEIQVFSMKRCYQWLYSTWTYFAFINKYGLQVALELFDERGLDLDIKCVIIGSFTCGEGAINMV